MQLAEMTKRCEIRNFNHNHQITGVLICAGDGNICMKRGFTTYVLWFNLQGAERVSYDYQFRKKVLESSGLIVLHFNVVGVLNYNFAAETDSEMYHLLPISDGFFSGFDTRLIDN